jgi:hypothetical protein
MPKAPPDNTSARPDYQIEWPTTRACVFRSKACQYAPFHGNDALCHCGLSPRHVPQRLASADNRPGAVLRTHPNSDLGRQERPAMVGGAPGAAFGV